MSNNKKNVLDQVVDQLCQEESFLPVYHESIHDKPMPSVEQLKEFMEIIKSVVFPGFFSSTDMRIETMKFHIGASVDRAETILSTQVARGLCFQCETDGDCDTCQEQAVMHTRAFMERLPEIRHLLSLDAQAAYIGDPAARSVGEAIFCYPSVHVLTNHRVAHELYKLEIPLIPRIISELAHGETGIDIHPGASLGEHLFIDHGTGTVIGETCVIGKNVRIYQGVTLGARSFPLDENGNPVKGIKRHPNVEDDVIIYSGATILGNVTIGKGAVIGGNVWLLEDVAPGTRVLQYHYQEEVFDSGLGI